MSARDISGQAPGGARTPLADVLPLDTPFVVQVFPVYACNFKCQYCIFSVKRKEQGFISDRTVLDFELYRKFVDELAEFPQKVKVLRFVGIGEPLLHKRIVEMIGYAADRGVANTLELLTNGSLLKPQLSDALVAAGLNRLVVSVQGTSAEKYHQVCGADIDFERFIEDLGYFYQHRGDAQVYIKIVDCALDGADDEQRFREIYGSLCDTIAIENAVPIHSSVDYQGVLEDRDEQLTQFGLPVSEVKICPQPFFHMQLNPDGKVVPCYSWEYPGIMGDCNEQTMAEIWNGDIFQRFRRQMLDGVDHVCESCVNCNMIKYRLFPEDVLNEAAGRLKRHYEPDKK